MMKYKKVKKSLTNNKRRSIISYEKKELYKKAYQLWGVSSQLDFMIEECSELVVAIQHWKRDRVNDGKVAEEIADVEIMCEQLRVLFRDDDTVDFWKEIKLTRLEECIKQTEAANKKKGE